MKWKRLLFCFLIALGLVSYQYYGNRQHYLRLSRNGRFVQATSSYRQRFTVGYADFSFVTDDGQTISQSQKCGNRADFDKEYANLIVVYNADDPHEFMTMYDFGNYSHSWSLSFFFGIYLIFLTFFLYTMTIILSKLYNKIREGR